MKSLTQHLTIALALQILIYGITWGLSFVFYIGWKSIDIYLWLASLSFVLFYGLTARFKGDVWLTQLFLAIPIIVTLFFLSNPTILWLLERTNYVISSLVKFMLPVFFVCLIKYTLDSLTMILGYPTKKMKIENYWP